MPQTTLRHRDAAFAGLQHQRMLLAVGLPLPVRTRFQIFHSLAGSFFAFPSRYWFTIGQSGVFSLEDGPHIQTGYHVSRLTIELTAHAFFVYGAVNTLYRAPFQTLPLTHMLIQASASRSLAATGEFG